MSIRVDPRVDFAFKKLLASPENADLLLDFLNSLLGLPSPVVEVHVTNPFNERDYEQDKLSVVDIKAEDAAGRRFQVEVQLQAHPALPARILYTWSRVYAEQLSKGVGFEALRPVYAIWLLDDVLLAGSPAHHHHFSPYDPVNERRLIDHLAIHLIELPKWRPVEAPLTPEDRWIYFFQSAGAWDELPSALGDSTMRKAMGVLRDISQHERDRARYQSRMDQLRVKRIYERQAERVEALEAEVKGMSEALAERDEALAEAEAELARLRARLSEGAP